MTDMKTNPIRWRQRFENFQKALCLLHEGMRRYEKGDLDSLAKEGVIQRFEFTFELAWKTLRDYLENEGVLLAQVTPRTVVKEAFAARIIADGDGWIEMLERRNLLSHTYDEQRFEEALARIGAKYLGLLEALLHFLTEALADETP